MNHYLVRTTSRFGDSARILIAGIETFVPETSERCLMRSGPFCPPISSLTSCLVIPNPHHIDFDVTWGDFFEKTTVKLVKVVESMWSGEFTGDERPWKEPEDFIINGMHREDVAGSMQTLSAYVPRMRAGVLRARYSYTASPCHLDYCGDEMTNPVYLLEGCGVACSLEFKNWIEERYEADKWLEFYTISRIGMGDFPDASESDAMKRFLKRFPQL